MNKLINILLFVFSDLPSENEKVQMASRLCGLASHVPSHLRVLLRLAALPMEGNPSLESQGLC